MREVAKGVLDEAVLWAMSTGPRAEGGAQAPWAPPGYATVPNQQNHTLPIN